MDAAAERLSASRATEATRAGSSQRTPAPALLRRRRAGQRPSLVQTKLQVGAAGDPYEIEADRIAEQVVRALASGPDGGSRSGAGRVQPIGDWGSADIADASGPVRRASTPPSIARIQRASHAVGAEGGALDDQTSSRIRSSGGRPLEPTVRTSMEGAFGADFGSVRVHTGSEATALNDQMQARAFTTGSDVFFRDGVPDTSRPDGQRLLAHELTHVVQQGSATARRHTLDCIRGHDQPIDQHAVADDITLADTGWAVRRHSSWEHMLIGDLDPDALATVGASYDISGSATKRVTIGKDAHNQNIMVGRTEVQHVIQQEIDRLRKFQASPPTVESFGKVAAIEQGQKQQDPTWDVTLVGVPNNSGKTFLVTYGELNTLGDFFGSVEEMKAMDPVWVDKLIRGVRQSTMRELIKVYAEVSGIDDEIVGDTIIPKEELAKEELGLRSDTFKSAGGSSNAVELGGVLNELRLMGAVPTLFAKPTVGGEASTDYASTLARNACHFAPESWHAWAGYHEKALEFADRAWKKLNTAHQMLDDVRDLDYGADSDRRDKDVERANQAAEAFWELRNEALLNNGFGDHYLQDSYAAGHLINKTRVMQMYVKWLDQHPGKWDAHRDKNWRKLQQIAYHQPGLTPDTQYDKTQVNAPRTTSTGVSIPTARNPQTVENLTGGWKEKAEALGLRVPPSVSDPDAKALLVEWMTICVNQMKIRNPRVQTVKTLMSMGRKVGHANAAATEAALNKLWQDGIIRKDSYSTSDKTKGHTLNSGDKLTLRDEYVPTGSQSLNASKGGDAGSRQVFDDKMLGVAYNDYLDFMNSSFLQKATNFLHDQWCKRGLEVQGDDGAEVFKVYGDDSMFKSGASKGLRHSGETAHMSRNSVIQAAETGVVPPTHSTQTILGRLPSQVEIADGSMVRLEHWESDRLMDAMGTSIFEKMSDVSNVFINKLVVGAKPGLKGAGLIGTISKDARPGGHELF